MNWTPLLPAVQQEEGHGVVHHGQAQGALDYDFAIFDVLFEWSVSWIECKDITDTTGLNEDNIKCAH